MVRLTMVIVLWRPVVVRILLAVLGASSSLLFRWRLLVVAVAAIVVGDCLRGGGCRRRCNNQRNKRRRLCSQGTFRHCRVPCSSYYTPSFSGISKGEALMKMRQTMREERNDDEERRETSNEKTRNKKVDERDAQRKHIQKRLKSLPG